MGGPDDNTTETDMIDDAEDRRTENPTVGVAMGYEVSLAIEREPSGAVYPDEFGVNLYIARNGTENIDIARIDTDHSGCHIDRLYLPTGHPQRLEDYGFQASSPEGAVTYITDDDRWREWVQRYDQNHGLP